jgi:hypothetical protein
MTFILLVELVLIVVSINLLTADVFPAGKTEMHCPQVPTSRVLLQSTFKVDMFTGTLLTPCSEWRYLAITT